MGPKCEITSPVRLKAVGEHIAEGVANNFDYIHPLSLYLDCRAVLRDWYILLTKRRECFFFMHMRISCNK